MNTHIIAFVLEAQEITTPEGLRRALVAIPQNSKVLHLGIVPSTDIVAVYALTAPPPHDENGGQKPYPPESLSIMEFIVAVPGQQIPKGYTFRAPVRTKDGGLIFLFEKDRSSGIITLGGRG